MVIVLVLLALIILTIVLGVKKGGFDDGEDLNSAGGFLIFSIIFSVILIVSLCSSYSSHINMGKTYYGTLEQFRNSIEVYGDKAIITIDKQSLTDLKYEGYQQNMAALIRDLRGEIVKYNKCLIGKREIKKSIIFSWLIIYDPSLPLIRMVE